MTRQTISLFFVCVIATLTAHTPAAAQTPAQTPATPDTPRAAVQTLVNAAARTALEKFADKKLSESQLAITLIDMRDPQHRNMASFRGDERIYPASVVKLFYLVAAHRWLEDGKLKDSAELQRAMRDMIVVSYNEATHLVLDAVSDTTSGPELPAAEMETWANKRNVVNRYFASLGYANINTNQKPWCEGPYGRDKVFLGAKYENRNKLTTNTTARLLAEIVSGQAVSPARSAKMMELLKRDYAAVSADPDDQANGFTGIALKGTDGARLWSKAGWTSTTRHDAAYIELPDGSKFVLVVFTTDHANEREIIPTVARVVIDGMKKLK